MTLTPDDYEEIPYPHPYIQVWTWCRKYAPPGGGALLPDPQKGPLDQDAELMLAFEILDEIAQDLEREQAIRARNQQLAQEQGFVR